jgi:secreted PhoX family phosphatase
MSVCDGIRTTPWGTIVATEETDDGRAYEILNPLGTTGHWVESRATGVIRTAIGAANPLSANVAQRQALPTMAWEGLEILPSGVVIGGDEERPGTSALDADGGAIFKFLPANPRTAAGPIFNLADSPLVSGNTYALTISCQGQGGSFPQYGQGCEIGLGAWVRLASPFDARTQANDRGATGYYRPEDLHLDPLYAGPGVRFCWANTGNSGASNFAEVVCGVDSVPTPSSPNEWLDTRTGFFYLTQGGTARANVTTVVANRFWEGDQRASAFDNLAFQPHTGNLYVIEDDTFGEIWACLTDGTDQNIKTDGCVAILSVIDPGAEPTGFIFDASGETAYVIVQHGQDAPSLRAPVNGVLQATDDLIKITGFKVK